MDKLTIDKLTGSIAMLREAILVRNQRDADLTVAAIAAQLLTSQYTDQKDEAVSLARELVNASIDRRI